MGLSFPETQQILPQSCEGEKALQQGAARPSPGLGRFGVYSLHWLIGLWMVLSSKGGLPLEWLKFAEIPPSGGRNTTLQGPASQKNNGATGVAQPCSEMQPAPHCLQGKVRKPSLEFKRLHNRPRLNYPALSRLRPPALAKSSSSLNLQAGSSVSLRPAWCPDCHQSSF